MAITAVELPNNFNFARQTIPFLVKSSLIGPGGTGSIDPIERAFRFVFDVLVQNSNGMYRTYASVAIPPRPDNFYSFFDAAPLVLDAISFDLGTHQVTGATACANSIVKFRVFCTERYLDTSGNFISGPKTSLGEFYAIDGSANEGILPHLIDNTSNKDPLHHHFLLGDDFTVRENEPLTLSWLSRNNLGVNELEYKHGNYGTFNDTPTVGTASTLQVMNAYTGITRDAKVTLFPGTGISLGGANSLLTSIAGLPASGNTFNNIISFSQIDLSPNKTYVFKIWARNIGSFALPSSTAYTLGMQITGTNFTVVAAGNPFVSSTATAWRQISISFATNSLFVSGDITAFNVRYNSTSALSPLSALNGVTMYLDSAELYEATPAVVPFVSSVEVVTADNTVYTMPTGYTNNIIPLNDTAQSRFDTPVGPYKIYHPTGQQALTGFWINTGGAVSPYFSVRIKNSAGTTVGESERIYQKIDGCSIYDKFRLKWKNSLGGWDYYTFDKVSKASTNIERENFKRSRGLITATSYSELSTDRGYKSLNIKLIDTYTIVSDWVNDGTAKWMQDLFTSDEVYLLNPEPFQKYVTTAEYDLEYPVFVQQTDIEYQNNAGDAKLKNFVVNITPAIRFEDNSTN